MLVLENDHTSPVLEWIARADAQGFTVDTVAQPADGDWTSAVLEAIERPGAPPVALASISSIHWSDGGLLDMDRVAQALRSHGAALLVDATHSVGVIATDVKALDPDFLIFPTYKWVLGPYGRAFVYVAKRHQDGTPLGADCLRTAQCEGREPGLLRRHTLSADARRYDMGERDHFISMEMAAMGMELLAAWGAAAVVERLSAMTRRIAEGLAGANNVQIPDERFRAPHILSLGFPGGMPGDLIADARSQQIYVAPRLGRMRISPHVYNDEADVDRFVAAMKQALA